jgi:hypothetical protein
VTDPYYGPYEEGDEEDLDLWTRDLPNPPDVRVHWDDRLEEWVCVCRLFLHTGKCHHLLRWRNEIEVKPDERYL